MFYVYVLFLILSGIAMLVMAFVKADYAKRRQALNFILGAGFLIYGLYLLLVFNGGTYFMFYYAFAAPILLIVQFFRDRSAFKARQMAASPAGAFQPGGASQPGEAYQPGGAYQPAGGIPQGGAPWMNGPSAGNGQAPSDGQGGYGQGAGQQGGFQNGPSGW